MLVKTEINNIEKWREHVIYSGFIQIFNFERIKASVIRLIQVDVNNIALLSKIKLC